MSSGELGYFGKFGGRFVPETLVPVLEELERTYMEAKDDPRFQAELDELRRSYCGRPTPLYFASNLSSLSPGSKIYLKREDLLHTGAHKINNAVGQVLLAVRMGKRRVIAETGAGQHGVAVATVCAKMGLECEIFMGVEDMRRQKMNVRRMELLGAKVRAVSSGSGTLKDATNEAIREWVSNADTTYYLIGSVIGPHPYPTIVRDFQRVIGAEIKDQLMAMEGRLPDFVVACVGGGSNAIGAFYDFIPHAEVRLVGVEAGGKGMAPGMNAASLNSGKVGVLHGCKTYVLQDENGQILGTHSISAGLDYPGVGPEHAFLMESGRATYSVVFDDEALSAAKLLARTEGIIAALESAHAVAEALKVASSGKGLLVVVNLSGRGDKDLDALSEQVERREGGVLA